MGNVMQQTPLTMNRTGQLFCHTIKILSKITEFITPFPHVLPYPCLQITRRHQVKHVPQTPDRMCHVPCHQGSKQQTGKKSGNQW